MNKRMTGEVSFSASGRAAHVPIEMPIEQARALGVDVDNADVVDLAGADGLNLKDAQELLDRIERIWRSGQPIFRHASAFRERTARLFAGIPSVDWFSELLEDPTFRRVSMMRGGHTDLHSTLMTWMTLKLREVSDTSNWFRLSEALAYKLIATDLRGAVCGDLRLPLPAFYVEMPAGMFYLEDRKTGWHEVRALVVARGNITQRTLDIAKKHGDKGADYTDIGPRVLIERYAEPNKNSRDPFDDSWLFMSYKLLGDDVGIEKVVEASIRDQQREALMHRAMVGERVLDGIATREFLLNFVLNLCVYLGSEKAKVEHVHAGEITKLKGNKKWKSLRKNVQERIRRLENDKVFLVGSDVVVDAELREYVRTEGTGGFKLTYRTLVRGHWRNQAHGPKRALRTRKWIEPHIRGADMPTKVVGHNYEVE